MWSAIELREIRVFLTLSDELHFGRTAERLDLTPSRVSQIIRDLEAKLGGELVHRTSRRVKLSTFGESFLADVVGPYEQLVETLQRNQAGKRPRPLRLGLFSDPGASRIPRIVKAFERVHPDCPVDAAEVPIEDPFRPLRQGEFDLVASWLPHGQQGLVTGPVLSSEPRVLAVSSDHPLSSHSKVSIEDVADYRVMLFSTMPEPFREEWIPSRTPKGRLIPSQPPSEMSIGDRGRTTSELVHLIATGSIVHPTVPSFANMFGHPEIVYVPIVDLPPLRSALVWREKSKDRRVREFARIAAQVVGSGKGSDGAGSMAPSGAVGST